MTSINTTLGQVFKNTDAPLAKIAQHFEINQLFLASLVKGNKPLRATATKLYAFCVDFHLFNSPGPDTIARAALNLKKQLTPQYVLSATLPVFLVNSLLFPHKILTVEYVEKGKLVAVYAEGKTEL